MQVKESVIKEKMEANIRDYEILQIRETIQEFNPKSSLGTKLFFLPKDSAPITCFRLMHFYLTLTFRLSE